MLALAGPIACGGDPAEPGTPRVGSLVLSRVPTGALRTGATAQLEVTARSGTGSTVSGAPVSWKSSDEAVATVSGGGIVTARAVGRVTVTATSGAANAMAEIRVAEPLTFTPSRLTVGLADGSVSLTALSLAGPEPVTVLVGPAPAKLADDRVVPGTVFEIAYDIDRSYLPIGTLTLRYDPARLPAGTTAGGLQLYHLRGGGEWVPIYWSVSDTSRRVVSGRLSDVGTYAVRFTPVDRVVLSGAQLDGALYVGQTIRLGAAAVSASVDTLVNERPTWSSSAPDVATVDAGGTVTGVREGTATLTATSGGRSASTQVQVLSRPAASWPVASNWTTFRGDSRRTGYVDATLDPVVFARRWEVTIPGVKGHDIPGAKGLNEPATGDGNVYVSSNSRYVTQGLWALDAGTGNVRWTHSFGAISTVNGPATGNGRVYVSTGHDQHSLLWSFDAADGAVRFSSPYGSQQSLWQAPAVTPDVVILGGGQFGGMSALDALDGTLLWRRLLLRSGDWTPAAAGGKAYAFGSVDAVYGLLALDGRTGAATLHRPSLPLGGTPVLGGGDDVYVISGRLLALDLGHGVVTWERPGAYQGVPAIDEANVYAIVGGQVEARGRRDGALRWTWVPQPGLVANGSVIVTRNLLFVSLVPSDYTESGGRVVALDLATRKVVWGHDVKGEIALGDGLLVVSDNESGKVTAISVR